MKSAAFLILSLLVAAAQDRPGLPLPAAGNVTLPLDEYNRLIELAGQPVKRPDAPPVPYAIQSADLNLQVSGEAVSGTLQLEGEVFAKDATRVTLATGLAVLDAQQKGRELPLQVQGETHFAVLPGSADFSIALRAGLPIAIEAGRASFQLVLPSAGTARLTLAVPGDHTSVTVTPGLITARRSNNGQTTIEATLVPGQLTAVGWTTHEVAAPPPAPREVRFLSDVKTLVSVGEADLTAAAIIELTVVQGEPAQFELAIPAGYEITGATGASLDSSDAQSGSLILKVRNPSEHAHQFLVSMAKPVTATKAEAPLLSLKGSQRETGETLVEAEGTMELSATEGGGLKRMDLKEVSPYLRSLSHNPLQAAFRYHRQPSETPVLTLAWVRFPDSSQLAAVAQQATVTTLVTAEGNSLTEVKLTIRNQAQPFLKVALPAGASILSADVAGEKVKPAQGPDGNRVPLLRPGFRPSDAYSVSFVFSHAGAPFAKKGGGDLALPKMDIPIGLMQWEVFLPEKYKVKDFGGDALSATLLPPPAELADLVPDYQAPPSKVELGPLLPGQLGGIVVDPVGALIPNARIVVTAADGTTRRAVSDRNGRWLVTNLPSGQVTVRAEVAGFKTLVQHIYYDANRPSHFSFAMQIAAMTETVEVSAGAAMTESAQIERNARQNAAAPQPASANVMNLQRRVAGVLPIKVDVPRTGSSYRFVRPLVLDEETRLTFTYKTR